MAGIGHCRGLSSFCMEDAGRDFGKGERAPTEQVPGRPDNQNWPWHVSPSSGADESFPELCTWDCKAQKMLRERARGLEGSSETFPTTVQRKRETKPSTRHSAPLPQSARRPERWPAHEEKAPTARADGPLQTLRQGPANYCQRVDPVFWLCL